MPAHVVVELGAQAQGHGRGLHHVGAVHEVGPDQAQLTVAEVVAVQNRGLFGGAHGAGVDHAAALFGERHQGGGDLLVVQARATQHARLHAKLRLGSAQRLDAQGHAVHVVSAHHVGGGGRVVNAFVHTHDHDHGPRLLEDCAQRLGQCARGARLGDHGGVASAEHRAVQREGQRVGVVGGGHNADHAGFDGLDRANTALDFDDAGAVVVAVECHGAGAPGR